MDWHWMYFLCVLFGVSADQYRIYLNPCPRLFQYQREGYEWVGLVQVHSLTLGRTMKFDVILSLPAKLPNHRHPSNPFIQLQYFGSVELYPSREDALQQIRFNQSVRYRIRFPSQNPLPELVHLSANGNVLCATTVPVITPFVTLIKLQHTWYTKVADGDIRDTIHSQDSIAADSRDDNFKSEMDVSPTSPPQEAQTNLPSTTYQPSTEGLEYECGTTHAKNNVRHLVVGGETVKRGTWPWLVAIYLKGARGTAFNCGGNLISARTVVTAAHCLRMPERAYQPNEVVLYLGRNNIIDLIDAGVKVAQVKEIVIHNDYMSNETSYDADIALLIMRERVQFTEFIRPICLWNGDDSISSIEGQLGTVVGWGRDDDGNFLTAEPKKISIPVVSEAECLRSSDTYRYITSPRTFCAGDRDGTGPCNGDSGGGMSFKINNKWTLRGIVSAALADPIASTCNLDEYVVFTDVAKFVGWIESYMQ